MMKSNRALKSFCAMVAILALMATQAWAETIENEFLKVTVTDGEMRMESKTRHGVVIPRARFAHPVKSTQNASAEAPAWGEGNAIVIEHENGWKTFLTLFDRSPFLQLHTEVRGPVKAESLDILNYSVKLGDQPLASYGTGGLVAEVPKEKEYPGSYTFQAFVNGDSRNGLVSAWLTHDQGVGVLFPSVTKDGPSIRAALEFGNFEVGDGKMRMTDSLLLGYFDDARLGLEAYADAVAKYYKIKLKPKPGVYCTWYHGGASNENEIAKNTEFADKNLRPFGLDVMQIDDKWQDILPKGFKHEGEKIKTTGPIKVFVDTKSNYSKGMAHTAEKITSHDMTAGIWFMPFAGNFRNPYFDPDIFAKNPDGTPFHDARWSGTCIDMSNPKAEAFVRERSARIRDWGYRYIKIDGLHTGMPSYNVYVHTSHKKQELAKAILHDPNTTLIQAYRKGLSTLREVSPDTFVLGCNVSQNMLSMGPAFGLLDAMRIGPDNGSAGRGDWRQVTKGAWHGTNLYFLNGRVWHNDPDPVYVRASNPIERARWMVSWLAVSGAMHTSSEYYPKLPADRLDLLKRCLPGHMYPARPVDLLETNKPRIWLVSNDRVEIVGLFNWNEKTPDTIVYDMKKLGLKKPRATYVGFDFWADKFIEPFKGKLDQTLPAASCRVLALRPSASHPQLLSTSRHITQGLMDVIEERWDAKTRTLSGKSQVVAGDRYELRVAMRRVPAARVIKAATANGKPMKTDLTAKHGIRASFIPGETGIAAWSIAF